MVLREKNLILTKIYNRLPLDAERIVDEYMALAERIQPMVVDTVVVALPTRSPTAST